ncbi:MAG: ankyrin repeat domain-containing protein [Candidatus Dependentiae bacterium]|nr:ankyrin repeat domain-containing protein [Candidatus Dependentiae bacterium]
MKKRNALLIILVGIVGMPAFMEAMDKGEKKDVKNIVQSDDQRLVRTQDMVNKSVKTLSLFNSELQSIYAKTDARILQSLTVKDTADEFSLLIERMQSARIVYDASFCSAMKNIGNEKFVREVLVSSLACDKAYKLCVQAGQKLKEVIMAVQACDRQLVRIEMVQKDVDRVIHGLMQRAERLQKLYDETAPSMLQFPEVQVFADAWNKASSQYCSQYKEFNIAVEKCRSDYERNQDGSLGIIDDLEKKRSVFVSGECENYKQSIENLEKAFVDQVRQQKKQAAQQEKQKECIDAAQKRIEEIAQKYEAFNILLNKKSPNILQEPAVESCLKELTIAHTQIEKVICGLREAPTFEECFLRAEPALDICNNFEDSMSKLADAIKSAHDKDNKDKKKNEKKVRFLAVASLMTKNVDQEFLANSEQSDSAVAQQKIEKMNVVGHGHYGNCINPYSKQCSCLERHITSQMFQKNDVLMKAVRDGNLSIPKAQVMIYAGAQADALDSSGLTALQVAAKIGRTDLVKAMRDAMSQNSGDCQSCRINNGFAAGGGAGAPCTCGKK